MLIGFLITKIVLSGQLAATQQCKDECDRITKLAAVTGNSWVIDSTGLTILFGGVTIWKAAVAANMPNCQIIYLPGPLKDLV